MVQHHVHARVDVKDGVLGGFQLGSADVRHAVDHLALQVAQLHGVVVDDAQRAHARCGQIQQRRGPQPAGSDDQDAGIAQPALALQPDFRNESMAGITFKFLRGQRRARLHQGWQGGRRRGVQGLNQGNHAS